MTSIREVLERPVDEAAPALLGARITHAGVTVRLTEVEAYGGVGDPRPEQRRRGRTRRNAVMFGPPGRLYVYFTYGMHHCCNVVCAPEGEASAVLLRAGEVVEGHEAARERRSRCSDRDLARGPGRLCQALGLTLDHDGLELAGVLELAPGNRKTGSRQTGGDISSGPRVGLRGAPDRPWRFWTPGEPTVSRYVAARPRASAQR